MIITAWCRERKWVGGATLLVLLLGKPLTTPTTAAVWLAATAETTWLLPNHSKTHVSRYMKVPATWPSPMYFYIYCHFFLTALCWQPLEHTPRALHFWILYGLKTHGTLNMTRDTMSCLFKRRLCVFASKIEEDEGRTKSKMMLDQPTFNSKT